MPDITDSGILEVRVILKIFLIAMSASVIGAIIYGALFAQRESQIRLYFQTTRRGWARRLYAWLLVGAIQGRDAAWNTFAITWLLVLIVFSFALLSNDIYRDSVRMLSDVDEMRGFLTTVDGDTPEPSLRSRQKELSFRLKELSFRQKELKRKLENFDSDSPEQSLSSLRLKSMN